VANRRKSAERPGRQKKRETLLELQERLKKAQQRNAALTSTLTVEEAHREALQTQLGELREQCSHAHAETQRLMDARRRLLAQADQAKATDAPIAAGSQSAEQHIGVGVVTSGQSRSIASPRWPGCGPGTLGTSRSAREQNGSPAGGSRSIKAEAPLRAAVGPSGGVDVEGGHREQSAVRTGVPQSPSSPPWGARHLVTPFHMGGNHQRIGAAATAADDGARCHGKPGCWGMSADAGFPLDLHIVTSRA
jgi:hypothetical protein